MTEALATALVLLAGAFLACLGLACLVAPAQARRFLLGFASSLALHYLELAIRLVVGGALLVVAPTMAFPRVFTAVGVVLVITTLVLALVPWRWHRHFAQRTVPGVLRFLPWLGLASLALGGFVVFSLVGTT
ncbi:MAG TPA: hypothetical protein DC063_01290 [Arenimonas sp.]|nr:MAG: hypothetical protein A2X76_07415 [Xanthomonadales bacterium GWF1_69_6]HBD18855.1 hypothetical protein [Arenimonas sp.]